MSKAKQESMAEEVARITSRKDPRSAIRAPKTAEIIADHIRRQIVTGELTEGDCLPPEGQLMQSLGTSRPTLREAFRILESEMLISVVRGSRTGARVHAPSVHSVSRYAGFVLQSQKTTIADIYAARLAIEPYAARQLAENPTPQRIERLRDEVGQLTQLAEDEQFVEFMIHLAVFHRVLVELTDNRTLLLITTILQDVVARYQVEFLKKRNLDRVTQRKRALWGLKSFYKLIDKIEAGDASSAEEHWRLHLIAANKTWVELMNPNEVIDVLD